MFRFQYISQITCLLQAFRAKDKIWTNQSRWPLIQVQVLTFLLVKLGNAYSNLANTALKLWNGEPVSLWSDPGRPAVPRITLCICFFKTSSSSFHFFWQQAIIRLLKDLKKIFHLSHHQRYVIYLLTGVRDPFNKKKTKKKQYSWTLLVQIYFMNKKCAQ